MAKIKAITKTQLKVFNETRPLTLRCKMIGHKFRPVSRPLPIRSNGRIQLFEIEGCVRCGHTELRGRV